MFSARWVDGTASREKGLLVLSQLAYFFEDFFGQKHGFLSPKTVRFLVGMFPVSENCRFGSQRCPRVVVIKILFIIIYMPLSSKVSRHSYASFP